MKNLQVLIYSKLHEKNHACDYLLIIYVQKLETNSRQFVFILPCGVNTLRLHKNPIGPKNGNGLLTCFMFAEYRPKISPEEKEQVLKSFKMLFAFCFKSSIFVYSYSIPKENQIS